MSMLKTYTQWAVQRFVDWQDLPKPEMEWSIKAKRIRNSYVLLVRTVLFLFQTSPEMSHEQWMQENTDLAFHINDILALLKDSADWSVCAIEDIENMFAIAPQEWDLLNEAMNVRFTCEFDILAKTFNRTMTVIKTNTNSNIRLRNAVVRLDWAFLFTEELLTKQKNGDAIAYLRKLNR